MDLFKNGFYGTYHLFSIYHLICQYPLKMQQNNKHNLSDVIWLAQSAVGLLPRLIWTQEFLFSKMKLCGCYQTCIYFVIHKSSDYFYMLCFREMSSQCSCKTYCVKENSRSFIFVKFYNFGLGLPQSF